MADGIMSGMGGLAASNPWTAGIMGAASVAQAALQPAGPSNSGGNNYASDYDGSAWSVSVGTGTQSSANNAKTEAPGVSTTGGGAGSVNGLLSNPLVLIALVAAFVLLRK